MIKNKKEDISRLQNNGGTLGSVKRLKVILFIYPYKVGIHVRRDNLIGFNRDVRINLLFKIPKFRVQKVGIYFI